MMQSAYHLWLVGFAASIARQLTAVLGCGYHLQAVPDSDAAHDMLGTEEMPDLLLLDAVQASGDGYALCRQLLKRPLRERMPLLLVGTAFDEQKMMHGQALGISDFLTLPASPAALLARVRAQLAGHAQRQHFLQQLERQAGATYQAHLDGLLRLGRAAEFRDVETGQHVQRMARYAFLIGLQAGLSEPEATLLLHAAPMHDIGKIGIPDHILRKPGGLTGEERHIMRLHPLLGAQIIGYHDAPLLVMAREVAEGHHEWWNGQGYPHGVQGDDIPLSARIVALADVFDALTTERPYKPAWPLARAIAHIEEGAGRQFAPHAVQAFRRALPDMLAVQARSLAS